MAKRARGDGGAAITGGTGDHKPQIMTLDTGIAGAINDYVVNQIALPVPRFGTMKTKATIFEMLWVDWYLNPQNQDDRDHTEFAFLTTSTTRQDGDTSSNNSQVADITNPRTFAFVKRNWDTSTAVGISLLQDPIRIDLTDSAGNGILVATDSLFVVGSGLNNAVVGSYTAKVAYRLVNVGITEYIGIVQSQQ